MLQNRNATFLFYDLETTGLNPAFDQILQFAAIPTYRDWETDRKSTRLNSSH